MATITKGAEIVALIWLLGWVPLAFALNFLLVSQVDPGRFTWRIGTNPLGVARDALTPLGQRVLTLYRWIVGLGLASWVGVAILAFLR
jgi:hypothetical protein